MVMPARLERCQVETMHGFGMIARLMLPTVILFSAGAASAVDQRIVRELMALTPQERMEQRCDIEAMDRIKQEQKGFAPDKVIAYTFSDPEISGAKFKASGAVFRSKGDWYRLKFKCETDQQRVSIRSFDYKIGDIVPRDDWQQYYLYE